MAITICSNAMIAVRIGSSTYLIGNITLYSIKLKTRIDKEYFPQNARLLVSFGNFSSIFLDSAHTNMVPQTALKSPLPKKPYFLVAISVYGKTSTKQSQIGKSTKITFGLQSFGNNSFFLAR